MTHLQLLGRTFQNMSGTSQQFPRTHSTDHDDASPISATHSHFTLFLSSCLLGSHPLSCRKLLLLEDSRMGTQVGLLLSTVNVSLNSRKRLVVDIWV